MVAGFALERTKKHERLACSAKLRTKLPLPLSSFVGAYRKTIRSVDADLGLLFDSVAEILADAVQDTAADDIGCLVPDAV